ncbi:MAG TPA: class I adenylate-forming enzyme family protein [Bdellovibrionota bacterium]|nr:class I adenylate-forming enzyme family protein [Bdellovibrionota bacterium]
MLIGQHLLSVAATGAGDPAILFLGKKTTYRELVQDIARLSYLLQHEVGHGPRMGLMTTPHPAVAKTIFAVSNVQGINVPLDPKCTDEELGDWIRRAGVTHLAITSDLATRTRDLFNQERLFLPVIEIDRKRGGEYDSSFTPQVGFEPRAIDPVMILRTSGGTREPMLVELTHDELQFGATSLRSRYHARKSDRYLTLLPWSTPYSLFHGVLMPLMTGGTLVIDEGRDNKELLEFLRDNIITRVIATSKICRRLLLILKSEQARLPQCVRSITVGMGTLSPQLRKAFGLMEIPILTVYGQVENGWTIAMEDSEEMATSLDNPPLEPKYRGLPGLQYKVLDQAGDAIEGREERMGHLAVSGPTVFHKYYGPPAKKEELEQFTRDVKRGTWLYTGDLARLDGADEELSLSYLGRQVDAHMREGNYTFADPADSVIKKIPGVEDGAAFFMQNAVGKIILACAVVRRPKATVSDQDVIKACRSSLDEEHVPKVVFFTDALPHDAAGGVNRYRLKRQYNGTLTG